MMRRASLAYEIDLSENVKTAFKKEQYHWLFSGSQVFKSVKTLNVCYGVLWSV